jgi:outer membrane scaffolding protein for murein synthesis (MipA/OmpV family)
MKRFRWVLALGLALGLPRVVLAETQPLWELGFGFGGLTAPDYRGSDEQRGYLLPVPYIVYRGKVLRVDRSGIYGRLLRTEKVRLDLSFDAGVPAKSRKNTARTGMPDLDPTVEVGPSLEVCLWHDCSADRAVQLRLPLRAVFATDFSHVNSAGWVFNPHLNLDVKNLGPHGGWNFGMALGPLYASEKNHDYYYQVDPVFATPARPAYDAHAGYSGTRLTLALSKRFDNFWLGTFARYDDLSGARFADSPLLRVRRSFMAGFGVSWFFAHSTTRVDVVP